MTRFFQRKIVRREDGRLEHGDVRLIELERARKIAEKPRHERSDEESQELLRVLRILQEAKQ